MSDSPINPARVDFVTLHLFCAVAAAGSITRGAVDCRLALSAASRRLSDFEAALGAVLFQRSARGVMLTPTGQVVLGHAQTLIRGFEALGHELARLRSGGLGQIRLWANMSALTEFLPDALAAFMQRHPGVQVDVEEQPRNRIVLAVKEGRADIGVIAGWLDDPDLRLDPLHRDELVLVCGRSHALAARRSVGFAETLDYEHIGLSEGTSLSDTTADAARRLGRVLQLRMQARSFDAACQMIAATQAVGILPRLACRTQIRTLGLRAVRLAEPWAQRQFFAVTQAIGTLSPAAQRLHRHLAGLVAQESISDRRNIG